MHTYCSIISKDYVHRGLMLYHSLKEHDSDFKFYFICLNSEVESLLNLMDLDDVVILSISQIEMYDKELGAVKATRNSKEFSWTAKGSILLYLFDSFPEIDRILWLDSDIMFYSKPDPIFEYFNKHSILLTRERFIEDHLDLNNIYGIFNTGLMGFKRDENTIQCLQTYRKKCIEWCFDIVTPGKWSDQMYVNYWPWTYKGVHVIENPGINATAWNIQGKSVQSGEDGIYVDGSKLVFYHYSGFRYNNYNEFDLCCYIDLPQTVKELIYAPYVTRYQSMIDTVNKYMDNFYAGMNYKELKYKNYYHLSRSKDEKGTNCCFCTITTDGYLLKCVALYESIKRHTGGRFHLWICTVDKAAEELLLKLNLSNATIVKVQRIENQALIEAKNNRYKNEYCWTIKASFIKYVLSQAPSVESVMYIDSDLYLFSDPSPLFRQMKNSDILLTSHNFTQGFYQLYEQKGRYNAGMVGFRNSRKAMQLLDWWEKKCIEWCYNQVIPNRFADQKYLETLGSRVGSAAIIKSQGVNAAMWNIENKTIRNHGNGIYINNDLLVAYHFSSFYILNGNEFDLWNCEYAKIGEDLLELVYLPYVRSIKAAVEQIKEYEEDISGYISDKNSYGRLFNHFVLEG